MKLFSIGRKRCFTPDAAAGPRAIQSALCDCAEAGGGRVVVPPGVWHTGALTLGSRCHLFLEEGAVVEFSAQWRDYLPAVFTRWEGIECFNFRALIYAKNAEDVSVSGKGVLKGNGAAWGAWKNFQRDAAFRLAEAGKRPFVAAERFFGTEKDALRPSFLQFVGCKNVRICGVTVADSPMWTIHPVYCENVVVRDVAVRTSGPNSDGIDPDSCRNIRIENCDFECGDDCIALKSGLNEDGMRVGIPCENVEIAHCTMRKGHAAVAIGSELSGGVRDVVVRDCKIDGTGIGLRIKTLPGRGGFVENVAFERIFMQSVGSTGVHLTTDYEQSTVRPQSRAATRIAHIYFRDVECRNAKYGIYMRGAGNQLVSDVVFENCRIHGENDRVREGFPFPCKEF